MVGTLIGGWHVCWSLLVLFGWAHMIQPVYVIKSFDPAAAITLIVITTAIGYVFGFAGAVIWNKLHRQ